MSVAAYPEYKDSGVDWLGKVPSHWTPKPLFAVVRERDASNAGMIENNLLSLSYGQIVRKNIDDNDGLLPASFETYQVVEPDDIVWRLTDLQNDKRSLRTAIVRERGIITSAYLATYALDVVPSFLNYLLRAYDHTKVFYSMGGGLRQSMKFSDVKWLPIVLPSLSEQIAIATFLDRETAKIDELVEEQRRLIALLKEKRQAVISHAVTKGVDPNTPMKDSGVEWLGEVPGHWEVKHFGMLATIVRGASPRPAGDPRFFGGDHTPWVTVGEITKDENMLLTETELFLTAEGRESSRAFKPGTLIYSNSGATLGVPKILSIAACANDGVVGFEHLDCSINIEFAYFYLSSLTPIIRDMVRQGSGQPNLNTDIVKAIKIGIPPKDEQSSLVQAIGAMDDQLRRLVFEAESGIALLQERRAALISAAVTGKIDVRDVFAATHSPDAA